MSTPHQTTTQLLMVTDTITAWHACDVSPQDSNNNSKSSPHAAGILRHKSAFTPPLPKVQTPPPDPPSQRLVLVDVDFEDVGVSEGSDVLHSQTKSQGTQTTNQQVMVRF